MRRKVMAGKQQRVKAATERPAAQTPARPGEYRLAPTLVAMGIILATLAAYGNLYGKETEFFRLDDGDYVVENPHVRTGLTEENIAWAFTAFHAANWHPLTWLSLQLDADIYGMNAGGFHLTNVIWHAAAAVLLLIVLERMTRAFWPSAFVAALFALHPLRVESVAWVAERKDVLSTFFWILTVGAYAWHVHAPSRGRYALVLISFALGLMAKPMLVTLPFALLLLDYWPLRRFGWGHTADAGPQVSFGRLLWEKWPLFAMSVAACVVTVLAQQVKDEPLMATPPLHLRVLNAGLAYVTYVVKTFWPTNLAPMYSRPLGQFPVTEGLVAVGAVLLVTGLAVVWARKRPYLPVGWFWFLGTLVPVIGIVQVGVQTMADRYTYVPHIGLLILIVWGLTALLAPRLPQAILGLGAGAVLVGCFLMTYRQAYLWQDNVAVWEHAVRVTANNYMAHDNLGVALMAKLEKQPQERRLVEDAVAQFRTAIQIEPNYPLSYLHLGTALAGQEKFAEAIEPLSTALRISPRVVDARQELALCYMRLGRMEEALGQLEAIVRGSPNEPNAHYNYAHALLDRGRFDEAEREAKEVLRLDPRMTSASRLLGLVYAVRGKPAEAERAFRVSQLMQGRTDAGSAYYLAWSLQAQGQADAAREQYRLARDRFPNWPKREREEAWKLATDPEPTRRNGPLAVVKAQTVSQATEDAITLDTLAAALAEAGRFPEAVTAARRAVALASADQKEAMSQRLRLYEQGQPFRSPRE